jgi:hypothetical protein
VRLGPWRQRCGLSAKCLRNKAQFRPKPLQTCAQPSLAEMEHGQDMVGFRANLLPLTGGGAGNAATSSITLTCGTEASPSERGSRSDGWVKKRFTLRVVTCRNSAAASTRANASACAKEGLSSVPMLHRGERGLALLDGNAWML